MQINLSMRDRRLVRYDHQGKARTVQQGQAFQDMR